MSYRAPDDRISEATGDRKQRALLRERVGARRVSILRAIKKKNGTKIMVFVMANTAVRSAFAYFNYWRLCHPVAQGSKNISSIWW
jgi:hypothetical protein